MKYKKTVPAIFLDRPNRFIAEVLLGNGDKCEVHVKNTGRCREILIKGTKVILEEAENTQRKTKYSLIAAYKGDMLINIDSQVPNAVVHEALINGKLEEFGDVTAVKREAVYGGSRFDLYYENEGKAGFIEVKGVTLETDGVAMFPDAPTERGARHVLDMVEAVSKGYEGCIFFLIQMKGIHCFKPNTGMDPEFSMALKAAAGAGVRIIAYDSDVTESGIFISKKVNIIL